MVTGTYNYIMNHPLTHEHFEDLVIKTDEKFYKPKWHVRARWLSFGIAAERMVKLWEPLKAFYREENSNTQTSKPADKFSVMIIDDKDSDSWQSHKG